PPNHRVVIEEGKEPQSEPFVSNRSAPIGPAAAATNSRAETLPEAVETWLLVPVPAPDFTLSDLAGGAITLSAVREKKALLQFCATEYEACVKGLRNLASHTTRWKLLG